MVELREIASLDEIEMESMGWSTAEMDALVVATEADDGEASDPADAPIDLPIIPVARAGDLWRLGRHRLLCGSALEASSWERLLAGEKARMAFADAPYNVPVSGFVCGLGKIKHEVALVVRYLTTALAATLMDNLIQRITKPRRSGLAQYSDGAADIARRFSMAMKSLRLRAEPFDFPIDSEFAFCDHRADHRMVAFVGLCQRFRQRGLNGRETLTRRLYPTLFHAFAPAR